jgi:hypothetical protein
MTVFPFSLTPLRKGFPPVQVIITPSPKLLAIILKSLVMMYTSTFINYSFETLTHSWFEK